MENVYLLVFDGLADWEVGLVTYELNTRNGIKVTTVGLTKDPITTGGGLKVTPDADLSAIRLEDTALLILPGGEMWHTTFSEQLAGVVLGLRHKGVPIAAICGATVFLARAGVFKPGVQHTSNSPQYLQEMAPGYQEQAYYRDAYAVSDRGVITAGGTANVEFTYEILKALRVYDDAVLSEFAQFWNCRRA
jgi:putative intracellular protease/amidase